MREHRARLRFTQAELAERVAVSRKTINTVENGVFVPSTVLALKLARALGVRVEDVFQLGDEAPEGSETPPDQLAERSPSGVRRQAK